MEAPPEYQPIQNITKENIDMLLPAYNEAKTIFFRLASSEHPTEQEQAGQAYNILLEVIHTLLELVKADNAEKLEAINHTQKEVEDLNTATLIDEALKEKVRSICGWFDTGPLRPHLKTQKNTAPCVYKSSITQRDRSINLD